MKKLLLLLALAGCMPPSDIHSAEMDRRIESGSLCQCSKAWQEHNLCDSGVRSGLCIEAVRGPFILTEVDSGEGCPHPVSVGIKDTFVNSNRVSPNWTTNENKVHWVMTAPANTRLYIHNIERVIPAGESLFIGTEGFNSMDSSRCYVAWVGYRPKERL